jgi:hypothetical protein
VNKLLYVVDEGGNASVNNITINPFSGDTIFSGTNFVLNTSYGSIALYSNGETPGKWFGL